MSDEDGVDEDVEDDEDVYDDTRILVKTLNLVSRI